MINKKDLDKMFLVFKPIVFVERQLKKARSRKKVSKLIYYSFNIISFLATFFVVSLTTIVFSKVWTSTIPSWFFYTTASISVLTAFTVSLANFFYVKESLTKYTRQEEYIEIQIAFFTLGLKDYKNEAHKEFNLFHNVCSHIGMDAATEGEHE